ncbi:MAG TPA: PEP-utilizing enzyme [Actinomycetota bacterium]|nr:PEP-utilizing enzyme [Actinomycetota bacterium]
MELRYRRLIQREQSVLGATLVALGSRRPRFESATGLAYGVRYHTFESAAHSVSPEDEQQLRGTIAERAGSEPGFWADHVRRGTSLGDRLIGDARSSLSLAEEARSDGELLEGLTALTEAMQEMAPFVVATPAALAVLESSLVRSIAEDIGGPDPQKASELLRRVSAPWYESDAVREMRSCYGIALEVLKNDDALEVFRTTSASIALRRVEAGFPELDRLIRDHVDDYGWLRAHGCRFEPMSAKDLVDRLQVVLIRWPAEAITQAAPPPAVHDGEGVLGFAPSASLARRIGVLQTMLTRRAFRVDVHLQAESLARPFFARIARALGCTTQQILASSADEIAAALGRRTELPMPEIEARIRNGFTVRRWEGDVEIHADGTPSTDQGAPAAGVLTGMTGCRGRAVGRVKLVLDGAELHRLEIGDVLVTAASTTDMMGGGTVFPTRTGGPPALEKAAAVVADEGGLLSHAAIVCRERGIPCVIGTERATTTLVDGQVVEVDATRPAGMVIPLDPS